MGDKIESFRSVLDRVVTFQDSSGLRYVLDLMHCSRLRQMT